jgi:hypothetical protein
MNSDIPGLVGNMQSAAEMAVMGAPPASERPRNYATVDKVRQRIQKEIVPLINNVRSNRQAMNAWWRKLFHVWTMQHDGDEGYRGKSKLFMPAGRKGIETLSAQLIAGTFPGDDVFGAMARGDDANAADRAENVKRVLKYRIDSTANVRIKADPFYRQLVITGNSPVKVFHQRKSINAKLRNVLGMMETKERILFDSPVFKPVDAADFYMWPESVDDTRDVQIMFEDLSTTYAHALSRARDGAYDMEQVKKSGSNSNQQTRTSTQDRLEAQELSLTDTSGGWGVVDITEIWMDFDPAAESKEEERNPVPFLITITAGGEVWRAIPNPFWHQMPPFLPGRMGITQGRILGTGFVEAIRELNRLLNDQTNQAMDAADYVINPIVKTNPLLVHGRLAKLAPGVQWFVTDIERAVSFERPPVELINASSILMTQTQSWIQDFMGAPPVLSGGGAPGRAFKTATGIGTAQANARLPLQEIVRLQEECVWKPMLMMFHSIDQQFAKEPFLVPGKEQGQRTRLSPDSIAGDWDFEWLASTQTSQAAMKGSQIMEAVSLLSNPKIIETLQANQVRVNPAPLMRRLFQEVLGIRNVDEVLIRDALGPPPPKPLMPEVSTQAPQPPGGFEQPINLPEEMQGPGFEDMREESESISALMGSLPIAGLTQGMS